MLKLNYLNNIYMEYLFFIILILAIFFDKNTIKNTKITSINNDKMRKKGLLTQDSKISNSKFKKTQLVKNNVEIEDDLKIEDNKEIQDNIEIEDDKKIQDIIEMENDIEIEDDVEIDDDVEIEDDEESNLENNDKLGLTEKNNFMKFLSGSSIVRENFINEKEFKINYNILKDYNDKKLVEKDTYNKETEIKDKNDIEYNYENVKQLDYRYKPKKKVFDYESMEDKNNRLINEDNNIMKKSNFVLEKLSGEDFGFSNIDKIDTEYSFFQKNDQNNNINYGNDYNNKKNIYSLNFNYNKINNKSKTFSEKQRDKFFNEKKDKYNILNHVNNNKINIYNSKFKNKNGIHKIKLNKKLKIAKPFERPKLNTKYNPILPNKTNLNSNQSIAFKGLDNFRNLKRETINKTGTIEDVSNNFNSLLVDDVNLEIIQENTLVSSKTIFKNIK